VKSPYTYINEVLDSRAGQSIYGAYTLNVLFSVAFLTVGTSLVISMKVKKLRRHFSLMRAIGTEFRTLIASFLIDSALTIAMGALVGGVIGTLMTFLILQLPLSYLGIATAVTWSRLPMVVLVPVGLVLAIITIAMVASIASTYLMARKGLNVNIADDMRLSD
jgi:ABC-type antimicrobial peptide transport system permease subunit